MLFLFVVVVVDRGVEVVTLCVWDPCFAILKDGSPTVVDGDDITVVVVGLSVVVLDGFTVGNGNITKDIIMRDGNGGGLSYPYSTFSPSLGHAGLVYFLFQYLELLWDLCHH